MAEDKSTGGIYVTTKDIYDEVTAMREEVREFALLSRSTKADLEDHETRMRALERWKYGMPLAAISSLGAMAFSVYQAAGK